MLKDEIDRLVHGTAEELGFQIYDFNVYLKGENSRIMVRIDSLSGISHKDCEIYSKSLSQKLDDDELLPNYSLEVSSPGVKRKIRSIEEFHRFLNAPVKIVYRDGNNQFAIKGKVVSVSEEGVVVSNEHENKSIPVSSIVNANLDY